MGADGRFFVLFAQLLWKFVEMVIFGLSRRLPIEGTFSKWVLMTTLLQRAVNGCQMTFLDAYQVRASFFKSASTLDTLTVANCLPQLAAR